MFYLMFGIKQLTLKIITLCIKVFYNTKIRIICICENKIKMNLQNFTKW